MAQVNEDAVDVKVGTLVVTERGFRFEPVQGRLVNIDRGDILDLSHDRHDWALRITADGLNKAREQARQDGVRAALEYLPARVRRIIWWYQRRARRAAGE